MHKTYIIADLHGRLDLLTQALNEIDKHCKGDIATVVLTGDYVDRGPHSAHIIELLMNLETEQGDRTRFAFLQGNHEQLMIEGMTHGAEERYLWLINGGGATLQSYQNLFGSKADDRLVEHVKWLSQLPIYFEDTMRIYVHAYVDYYLPLDAQNKRDMQWKLYPKRDQSGHVSGRYVVHGHHQHENGPIIGQFRANYDTFAWATGRLVVGVFDNTQHMPIDQIVVRGEPDARYSSRSR